METNEEGNIFFTIKDQKENFNNRLTVRLINPAKNELGRISKLILDQINKKISQKFELNQWKITDIVNDWSKQIKNKHLYQFATFDIKEFYLSITESLLKNNINFAEQHQNIRNRQMNNIPRQKISTFQWPARLDKKERRVIWCNYGSIRWSRGL